MSTFLLDLIFVAFVALIVLIYTKLGAVKSVYSLIATLAAGLAAYFLGPIVGSTVIAPFFSGLTETVYSTLVTLVDSIEGAFDISSLFDQLPAEFTSLTARAGIDVNSLKDTFGSITVGTEEDLRRLAETISAPIIDYVSRSLGCVAVYIAVTIAMIILKKIIFPIMKLPLLKQADGILGAIIGVICAVAYTWVICIAMSVLVEYGLLGEYNETVRTLTSQSYIYKLCCELSPVELIGTAGDLINK